MFLVLKPTTLNNSNDENSDQNHPSTILNQSNENTENKNNFKQRSRFTKEEDDLLRDLVEKQNEKVDWSEIASLMNGRTSRQCRDRYTNYLRPQLVNGAWTEEEEKLLEKMYEKYGPQWSRISQYFPNRSDVNIKNHHTCLVKKISKQQKIKNKSPVNEKGNSSPDDRILIENSNNNSESLLDGHNKIMTPIIPIEVNNNNHAEHAINQNEIIIPTTNPTETYKFKPSISNTIYFTKDGSNEEFVSSISSNQEQNNTINLENDTFLEAIANLAKSQQINIDENLVNRKLPLNAKTKNEILKNTFSLLVNLCFLISSNEE